MMDAECIFERPCVLHQEAARLVGLEKPLVRVHPDRIRAFDPAQNPLALVGHHREAPVCAST